MLTEYTLVVMTTALNIIVVHERMSRTEVYSVQLLPTVTSPVRICSQVSLITGVPGFFPMRTETCFIHGCVRFIYDSTGHRADAQDIVHELSNQLAPHCLL